MNNKILYTIQFIMFCAIIFLFVDRKKLKNKSLENFTNNSLDEAITNLSKISSELLNNDSLTIPGNVTIKEDLSLETNLNVDGNINFLPRGCIIMWHTDRISDDMKEHWAVCDGKTVNGFTTPDLRGRFVLSAGSTSSNNNNIEMDGKSPNYDGITYHVNNKGGERKHQLDVHEMPSHTHGAKMVTNGDRGLWATYSDQFSGANKGYQRGSAYGYSHEGQIERIGNDGFHNNMPPYYVLTYIIKIK